jgi:flagellin-like protein
MKGMTNVITTVLLLLMAVAAVGGVWVWYQRMQTSSMSGGSSQVESMVGGTATLTVDRVECETGTGNYLVTIMCVTTGSITIDELKIYNSTGMVGSETANITALTFVTNTVSVVNVTDSGGACSIGKVYSVDIRKGVNFFQRAFSSTAE